MTWRLLILVLVAGFIYGSVVSCKPGSRERVEEKLAKAREALLASAPKPPVLTEPIVKVTPKSDKALEFSVAFDPAKVNIVPAERLSARLGRIYFGKLSDTSIQLFLPDWNKLSLEAKMLLGGYFELVTLGGKPYQWKNTTLSGILSSCEYFLDKHNRLPKTLLELLEFNGIDSLPAFEKIPEEEKRTFLLPYTNFLKLREVRINPEATEVPGDIYLEPITLSQMDIERIQAQLLERTEDNQEWDFAHPFILTINDFNGIALRGIWVPRKNLKLEAPYLLLKEPEEKLR